MSKLHNRLTQLEKIRTPKPQPVICIYHHDIEKGYSKKSDGPYFATLDELAAAQGRTINDSDLNLIIEYASQQPQVFIPSNGREN